MEVERFTNMCIPGVQRTPSRDRCGREQMGSYTTSLPVDVLPVPCPIEHNVLAHYVIPDSIGPDLQAVLANALALELLDLGRRTERVGLKALQGVEDLLLGGRREIIEVALEARGEPNSKAGWHVSQPGGSVSL